MKDILLLIAGAAVGYYIAKSMKNTEGGNGGTLSLDCPKTDCPQPTPCVKTPSVGGFRPPKHVF